MTKQVGFAFWAFALVATLSACTDVRKCKIGEPGCIGGPPSKDGCSAGLELVGGKCVEPGGGGAGSDGSDMGGNDMGGNDMGGNDMDGGNDMGGNDMGGNDMDGTPTCECDNPEELCTGTGECVNFCEVPEKLPGSEANKKPEVVSCFKFTGEPDLTFEEVCVRRCKLRCQRIDWFCPADDACDEDACAEDNAAMLKECADDCGADIMCLQESCQSTRGAGCGDTTCPSGEAPNCESVRCSNTCPFAFDGWCDDGDIWGTSNAPGSEDTAACTWGTDCADCGPRRGNNEPKDLPQGSQCHFSSVCLGYAEKRDRDTGRTVPDLRNIDAWCVRLEQPVAGNWRCIPDASGQDESCPPGYEPRFLDGPDTNGDNVPDPIIVDGLRAKGCIPTFEMCK